jgi:hypothetical protein
MTVSCISLRSGLERPANLRHLNDVRYTNGRRRHRCFRWGSGELSLLFVVVGVSLWLSNCQLSTVGINRYYDVAVLIREPGRWLDEVIRLADLGTDILMDTGAVISAKPFSADAYDERSPLMREILREGVDL